MNDVRATLGCVAGALLLSVAAWITTPPGVAEPQERGESIFTDFIDPNAATALEVVEFDPEISAARPFKVHNRDGRWTIPSRYEYPADAEDRLSTIAAAMIAMRKEGIASENVSDHERLVVLDPLDETLPGTAGRGTRIIVRGQNEQVLANLIMGRVVDGHPELRYVRLPSQRRTYVAHVGPFDISTRFEDWIARNLLTTQREEIDQVLIRNYTIDSKSGRVSTSEIISLRSAGDDRWVLDRAAAGARLNEYRMNLLITRLVDLEIADVRPKPPTIRAALTAAGDDAPRVLASELADMEAIGFYFGREGSILSSAGEVAVRLRNGIFYTLRFGHAVGAQTELAPVLIPHDGPARYLLISVGYDPGPDASPMSEAVRRQLALLRARFVPWYFVISDKGGRDIRLTKADLLSRDRLLQRR